MIFFRGCDSVVLLLTFDNRLCAAIIRATLKGKNIIMYSKYILCYRDRTYLNDRRRRRPIRTWRTRFSHTRNSSVFSLR